jgi:hypothetical protein
MNQNRMQGCIEDCQRCAAACLSTLTHCLQMGGEHVRPEHVRAMLDCVDACQTAANFMLRGSAMHGRTCAVCAEACTACAVSCERMNDATMKSCAETCRHCAASCAEMARSG